MILNVLFEISKSKYENDQWVYKKKNCKSVVEKSNRLLVFINYFGMTYYDIVIKYLMSNSNNISKALNSLKSLKNVVSI
jgi:hypothetical protein